MKHKVRALDTYSKLKIKDAQFDEVLPIGYEFEVDDERLNVLLGSNKYKVPFVEEIKEEVEKVVDEVKEQVEEVVEKKPSRKKKK